MKKIVKRSISLITTIFVLTVLISVNIGVSAKASSIGSKIVSIYGTKDLTYSEYYAGEIGRTASELNYDKLYRGTKSVVVGDKLDKVPGTLNYSTSTTSNIANYDISGMKNVDVVVQKELFSKLNISNEDTENNIKNIISKLKESYNIDVTYFIFDDGIKKTAKGTKVDSLPIATVKALKADDSFAKSETVEDNTAIDFSKPVNGFAPNGYVASYNNKYGDVLLNLDYSEDYNVFSGWANYKNNIYAVTLTNQKTGQVYGMLWADDVWSVEDNGAYLSLAVNTKTNDRFKDFEIPGEYTISVFAKGYKTVEAKNIKINNSLATKPVVDQIPIAENEGSQAIAFKYTGVDEKYVAAVANAKFTLINRNNEDVSANLGKYDSSTQSIKINNSEELVKKYGAGYYTLFVEAPGYQKIGYLILVTTDLEQPSLKVGNIIYGPNDTVRIVKGEPVYLVDKDGNFINGYASLRTVTINEVDIPGKGIYGIQTPAIKYDETKKLTFIDTTIGAYKEEGDYKVVVKSPGYKDFTYKIQTISETEKELEAQKVIVKNSLDTYKNADEYRIVQKTELVDIIKNGKAIIDKATTKAEVETLLISVKASIDAIKTSAQLTTAELEAQKAEEEKLASELVAQKIATKSSLDNYKNVSDYREVQKAELVTAINSGKANIDKATVKTEVETALKDSKAIIDAIKINVQLAAEELEAQKAAELEAQKVAAQKAAELEAKPVHQDDGSQGTGTGDQSALPIVASLLFSIAMIASLKAKKAF